jgi:hypothetical protein
MRPRTLRLLERLARREVDEAQRELAAVEGRRREVAAALARERSTRPAELAAARALPAETQVASGFWRGSRERETALDQLHTSLAVRSDELRGTLTDRLAAQWRYAHVAAVVERRRLAEQAQRELTALEDADRARRWAIARG